MTVIVERAERPLWRRIIDFPLVAMIAAVALFLLAVTIANAMGRFVSVGPPTGSIIKAFITFALTLATYKLIIVRLGEHPRDDLRATGAFVGLAKGVAAGAILFAAVVGIAALLGIYRITGEGQVSNMLMPLINAGVMAAFMEELLFRGILFRWIEEFVGSWLALLVTSALFGLAHVLNPGATWFSTFAIAAEAGLLLGGTYMLTRSLWMPMGLHAAWNFTQGGVFGVPVSGSPSNGLIHSSLSGPALLSGGSFGLEASIIAVAICTSAAAWFIWLAANRGAVVRPRWARARAVGSS